MSPSTFALRKSTSTLRPSRRVSEPAAALAAQGAAVVTLVEPYILTRMHTFLPAVALLAGSLSLPALHTAAGDAGAEASAPFSEASASVKSGPMSGCIGPNATLHWGGCHLALGQILLSGMLLRLAPMLVATGCCGWRRAN